MAHERGTRQVRTKEQSFNLINQWGYVSQVFKNKTEH